MQRVGAGGGARAGGGGHLWRRWRRTSPGLGSSISGTPPTITTAAWPASARTFRRLQEQVEVEGEGGVQVQVEMEVEVQVQVEVQHLVEHVVRVGGQVVNAELPQPAAASLQGILEPPGNVSSIELVLDS